MAKLLLFASVREKVGVDWLRVNLEKPVELSLFLQSASSMASVSPDYFQAPHLLYSVNGEMADLNTMVHDGDEVAVLPPLSGGV